MSEWLTKEERMQMHQMREDYIEIFHTRPELREENPKLWHSILTSGKHSSLNLQRMNMKSA